MKLKKTLHITTISITAYCFLRSWFKYLNEHGNRVVLACTANEFIDELKATGAEIVNIPIARSVSPIKDLISLIKLWFFIKKGKFDSVHTHTTKAGFLGRLAAKLNGIPLILHTIHDLPQNSARNPILKKFYMFIERLAALWAHHIITVSYANMEDIRKWRIAPEEKVTVIHEGIELNNYKTTVEKTNMKKMLSIPENASIIGIVARLEAAKGHKYLLMAAKEILMVFPDCYFLIVGKGHLRENLEKLAEQLGISSRIIFTGFRNDMLDIINTFDIFVLPSLWEGLGIVLLEAMAFSKPIVASRVGGIKDVVVDGETGILVPPSDHHALAQAIMKIIGDKNLAKTMGEKGYIRVRDEFRDSAANENMMRLYDSLLNKNKMERE